MVFIIILVTIFLISFLWALWSLKRELTKSKEIKTAEKELAREKILFKSE